MFSRLVGYMLYPTNQLNTLMDVGNAISRVMLLKYVLASTSKPTVNICTWPVPVVVRPMMRSTG